MKKRGSTNIAASVRQRLLNKARAENRPFAELLQYYAMERFLYRLSRSVHANKFVLKGALLLRVWHAPLSRPTMDIDMLGKMRNEVTEFDFDRKQLAEAIARTFHHRGTDLPDEIDAFSESFVNAKSIQWSAFRRKLNQDLIPADFAQIIHTLRNFIEPVIKAPGSKLEMPGIWKSPGPWS